MAFSGHENFAANILNSERHPNVAIVKLSFCRWLKSFLGTEKPVIPN